jgi:O-acetyl-ADP-ribose deacetylase (regulator of RNase III)
MAMTPRARILDGTGSILDAQADAIVIPVNCVGVMGAGLALAAAQRWPELRAGYRSACEHGNLRPGTLWGGWTHEIDQRFVVCLPTKRHWKDPSRLDDVRAGLSALRALADGRRWASVAVPALGCGLGGLSWSDVRPLVVEAFTGSTCGVFVWGHQ